MTHQPPPILDSIVKTIGNTPIVRLSQTFRKYPGQILGKIESFNPGGSTKDRIGVTIIDDAEERGLIQPGATIVEATSGNTGLGLALVGIERGYNVTLVMPDKMSADKMNLVKAIGCNVIVCPTDVDPDDPKSYYSVAKEIASETENSFYANQYFNPANPKAHFETTGPEIWSQTKGEITHFFAGVGTGGTISGVGEYLKKQNPKVKIIGIDPEGSILAHFHKYRDKNVTASTYKVEGVGEDIIPSTVNFDVIDEFVTVNDQESFSWTRRLANEEGLLLGGSSGLAAAGAAKYVEMHSDPEMMAVILFPDTGERYLDRVYSDAWLRSNGFLPPPETITDIVTAKPANLPPVITVSPYSSLRDALEKIKKFRINQIVVTANHQTGQILKKGTLYDALLKGQDPSNTINKLSLKPITTLDCHGSLTELIYSIIHNGVVLITDNDKWMGLLTKQDIIDNMPIDILASE